MKTYYRNQSGRMFETEWIEALSKGNPVLPFLFYIPIAIAVAAWSLVSETTTVLQMVAFVPAGWVTWQLMEYFIHRDFFHWEGNGPFTRRLHEIVHGYHHKYPDDALRLVMPVSASLPVALLIALLLRAVGHGWWTVPYWLGLLSGYLFYDFTHWATHHRKPTTSWGRAIRSHHMAHHFADPNKNFGISHRWVDAVLGTLRRREATSSDELAPSPGPQP